MEKNKYYIDVGRAVDLRNIKERRIYRALEIFPGFLVWLTLLGMFICSWLLPVWTAYFIIIFSVYWMLRTFHFSFYIVFAYRKMKLNLKADWIGKLNELVKSDPDKNWQEIYHLIIFPMYKESSVVIRESFKALVNSDYPKDKMIVVLAIEERAGESAREVADVILKEYHDKFFRFLITIHPKNIVREIAGKGSNESWAGKKAKEIIIDPLKLDYSKIIVSSFDIDAQVYAKYFSCLTYYYLTSKNPTRSSFQPIPLYFNNFYEAPFFSRVVSSSNVFWQMLQQQRPEKITTYSSHSMAFKALVEMDFWQTNVVSEDAGVFWKAFLFYDGDYEIIPMHYPLSMDACLGSNIWKTAVNQYKQQRRWAWGAEGIPYLLFGFFKNKKIAFNKKFRYSFLMLESFWAWGTNALLILFLGWLPLFLGGNAFNTTVLFYNLPQIVRNLMTIALIGLLASIIVNTLLLRLNFVSKSKWQNLLLIIQWAFLPFSLIIFGAIPAIEAQTRLMFGKYMSFWVTEKARRDNPS
ncbi:MAG: glycosyltransferase family 2 protein [Candidatus Nealsonbacteria bacterium]|nr:glycosyltransferase family 2 protein [Candidatus Nealsonbacteria bacterium]